MKPSRLGAHWYEGGVAVTMNSDDEGKEKRIVLGNNQYESAVITNLDDGAYLTILEGKKIKLIKRKISSDYISSDFVMFLLEKFKYDNEKIIAWLIMVTEEEFNQNRLLYALR